MNCSPCRALCRPREENWMGREGEKRKCRRKLGRRKESDRQIRKNHLLDERGNGGYDSLTILE